VQVVCDGCGKSVSCGSGKAREHAHVVRARLRDAGWRIDWSPDGDLCEACRPAPWAKLNWCDDPPAGLTVRKACRQRVPLDGADAQALEHALTMTEGERDSIRAVVDAVDGVLQEARVHHASRAEAVRGIVLKARQARSLLAEVALWNSGALRGEAARTLLDRVRDFLA